MLLLLLFLSRHVMDMAFNEAEGGRPGPHDVVIYFRDFLYVRQKRHGRMLRHNLFEWWQGRAN